MNIADIFKVLAFVGWVALGVLFFVIVTRSSRSLPVKGLITTLTVLAVVALVITLFSMGIVFINPEERGVVVSAVAEGGGRPEALQPGLSFVIPGVEQVKLYPISRQTYTMSSATGEGQVVGDDSIRARTKDGQEVFIEASVIYSIDPSQIVKLHINWQDRYQDEVVRPLARGIIRDIASQYGVEEIVSSKRVEMEQKITDELIQKLGDNELLLTDFVLRDIHFSDQYAQAVEQKQIAEQQAQQAKFVVETKKQEAEQARQTAQGTADAVVIASKGDAEARLIQADAERKALELIAQALKDKPELLTYQYITKLAPNIQAMFLPSNAPFVFPLPQTQSTETPVTPVTPTTP
jgi:regulator of protease activity HflC (stomatin/prohibitin superfamily)